MIKPQRRGDAKFGKGLSVLKRRKSCVPRHAHQIIKRITVQTTAWRVSFLPDKPLLGPGLIHLQHNKLSFPDTCNERHIHARYEIARKPFAVNLASPRLRGFNVLNFLLTLSAIRQNCQTRSNEGCHLEAHLGRNTSVYLTRLGVVLHPSCLGIESRSDWGNKMRSEHGILI